MKGLLEGRKANLKLSKVLGLFFSRQFGKRLTEFSILSPLIT